MLLGMFDTFGNDQKGYWSEYVAPTSDPSDSSQGTNFQKTRRQVALHHTDIIGNTFWNEHGDILDS